MAQYDHKTIEAKWRERWADSGIYETDVHKAQRPFYNLMMFPYPSGEGLHVGNVRTFTGVDVHARFKAMQGHDVLQPFGYDAFGIHSENFALKQNIHPMTLIPKNIARFREQIFTTAMSEGGDSGSMVLDLHGNAAGLLFAGSATHTIMNSIEYVQSSLDIVVADGPA